MLSPQTYRAACTLQCSSCFSWQIKLVCSVIAAICCKNSYFCSHDYQCLRQTASALLPSVDVFLLTLVTVSSRLMDIIIIIITIRVLNKVLLTISSYSKVQTVSPVYGHTNTRMHRHICKRLLLQVSDGIFQRLEKCVVMMGRGMSVQQAKDTILSDVETNFVAAGLLDDTPQQKPGLKASSEDCKASLQGCQPCLKPLLNFGNTAWLHM